MTTITSNGYQIGLVDVPEGSDHHHLDFGGSMLCYWYNNGYEYVDAGEGFNILGPGLATQCSEEDAREIVEWYGDGNGSVDEAGVGDTFMCYDDTDFCFDTALASLHSLIRANGKEPSTIVIVYKKL